MGSDHHKIVSLEVGEACRSSYIRGQHELLPGSPVPEYLVLRARNRIEGVGVAVVMSSPLLMCVEGLWNMLISLHGWVAQNAM